MKLVGPIIQPAVPDWRWADVGLRIRDARVARNLAGEPRLFTEIPMTQGRLAVLCAVSVPVLDALERGQVFPTPKLRARLSRILGIPERQLFALANRRAVA